MWFDFEACEPPRDARGRWDFGGDFSSMFGGGRGRRRGGPFRGGRIFEQGDLKYVILQLLADKPRHGYEIIKALEDRFAGAYAPSAGTVYPTLSLLEDIGYATVTLEEGGKKIYAITDEGRKYLEENRSAVDDIFDRITDLGASFLSDSMGDLSRSYASVGRAVYASAARYYKDKEKVAKVREILERAARDIDEALAATKL
ncbi:MAG: PadR family transcriptional regulator [Gemmatimonadaceae bacterium]